jgi:hypothetical protein
MRETPTILAYPLRAARSTITLPHPRTPSTARLSTIKRHLSAVFGRRFHQRNLSENQHQSEIIIKT